MALTDQIIKLFPTGEGWPTAQASNLWKTVNLFVGAIQRAFDFADYATTDCFVLTSKDTLSDWKSSVGLPDPACPPLTAAQERLQMIARVENTGGQSPQYFIDYASNIGYTITITELAVPRAGLAKAGLSQSNSPGGDFVWVVNVANATISYFHAGINRAGDPLSTATDILWLQYELNRIKPSHTILEWT